jgi:hypothetical protein
VSEGNKHNVVGVMSNHSARLGTLNKPSVSLMAMVKTMAIVLY